ncbi:dihydrolipoyl dehydrogenase [Anoxybacterium hadale]|uniref:Dihydrolipoyl dehydrogenase n=1 Tax=Anoxybacterium hadale TaxID=3408580 RepID=A0ACD1A962_9FIRM|nr:dihydrolipoyl dehydrogenase [Clostridiales bacterium]
MMKPFDVAVIGGGPAGYVAAIRAAQLGGSVVLFEKDVLGGTCLNRGCIPTKTYLKTGEVIHAIKNASERGIRNHPDAEVDMERVVSHKNKIVGQLTGGVASLLKSNGVTVIYGTAVLSSRRHILCNGNTFEAKSIILCGGSVSSQLPIKGIINPKVMSSTELLNLALLPKRLAVIGGGVIGCEMASAFQSFGSQVTILEAMDCLIPMMDQELAKSLEKDLKQQGISLLLSKKITEIIDEGSSVCICCEDGTSLEADIILLSVGRKSDLECLGALKDQILVEGGKIVVDEYMRTNITNLYAAGDINGRLMLAHAAFKMGETAAENAMGHNARCRLDLVPSCVYTLSQVASVGLTEDGATETFGRDAISVGRFPLIANGRALAGGESQGYVKVVVHKKYSELCGVHIFGAHAAEMIAEPAALMAAEITVFEAANMIHAHPSFSEAFMEACADALGRCIHLPKRG